MKIIDITKCPEEVISYINELQNKYAELEKLIKELDKSNITMFEENQNLAKEIEKLKSESSEYWHERYYEQVNIINELNDKYGRLTGYIGTLWLDSNGIVRNLKEYIQLLENKYKDSDPS